MLLAAAGEQCWGVVQRDGHQLRGARGDGPPDQLLRGQDAHRGAPAALPPLAHHQPHPKHQLPAWSSQRKSLLYVKQIFSLMLVVVCQVS